jgi:hypothetical protein
VGLVLLRVWTAAALVASGALMYVASWQRWAGPCPWGEDFDTVACNLRQDHLYDFIMPVEPWRAVGDAAELAGASLLALALALPVLPLAIRGRRPGALTVAALLAGTLAVADIGTATLRSGLAGEAVRPLTDDLAFWLWLFVPLGLFVHGSVHGRGWARLAALLLVLGAPVVAAFSYAIGSFDAAPWWEAISGIFTAAGGVCVLVAAVRRRESRRGTATQPAVAG